MHLYAGSVRTFIELNQEKRLVGILQEQFLLQFGRSPSDSEVRSWRHSLLALATVLTDGGLLDQGILLEYKLPLSALRVDVILFGRDSQQRKQAIVIELKQWQSSKLTDYNSPYVLTRLGGEEQKLLHPSIQVGNYFHYLKSNNSAFYREEDAIGLSACSYLHNYQLSQDSSLLDERFEKARTKFPLFGSEENARGELADFIYSRVGSSEGISIMEEALHGELRPSKKLLEQVSNVVREKMLSRIPVFTRGRSENDFILLDNQLIAYDAVMSLAEKPKGAEKHAIIINGGAGTGKSVIALQLLANLGAQNINVHYATGSKSFTATLREILGGEFTGILKYFLSYVDAKPNSVDVLLMDEAHRIRERTGEKHGKPTGLSQTEELLSATRIAVFFIDDFQRVRMGEIGSAAAIRKHAEAMGCIVHEYTLKAQFRHGGSEKYSLWIDNILGIQDTGVKEWRQEENFEFHIMDSPEAVEQAVLEKVALGYSGRIAAGFCWPWTQKSDVNGELYKDVTIGDYSRPWNASENTKGMRAGIPKSQFWAYDDAGIDQVGCIYTAQGFDFDYTGVIFGNDLRYNPDTEEWEGSPNNSYDNAVKGTDFLELVKNTYRVLLGRGMKACYVYFMDKETERYFKSRMRD